LGDLWCRFIGNSLERPQLILKGNKIRETGFDEEQVQEGEKYEVRRLERSICREAPQVYAEDSCESSLMYDGDFNGGGGGGAMECAYAPVQQYIAKAPKMQMQRAVEEDEIEIAAGYDRFAYDGRRANNRPPVVQDSHYKSYLNFFEKSFNCYS
jgi:hypothetical protein